MLKNLFSGGSKTENIVNSQRVKNQKNAKIFKKIAYTKKTTFVAIRRP